MVISIVAANNAAKHSNIKKKLDLQEINNAHKYIFHRRALISL